MDSQKPELTIKSSPREKLRALVNVAEYFNSGLAQIVCSDDDGKVVSVGVVAEGEYAEQLARWLKRMAAKEARHA